VRLWWTLTLVVHAVVHVVGCVSRVLDACEIGSKLFIAGFMWWLLAWCMVVCVLVWTSQMSFTASPRLAYDLILSLLQCVW
jgi:hypothetical protein